MQSSQCNAIPSAAHRCAANNTAILSANAMVCRVCRVCPVGSSWVETETALFSAVAYATAADLL